jgi:hypothetical protein
MYVLELKFYLIFCLDVKVESLSAMRNETKDIYEQIPGYNIWNYQLWTNIKV